MPMSVTTNTKDSKQVAFPAAAIRRILRSSPDCLALKQNAFSSRLHFNWRNEQITVFKNGKYVALQREVTNGIYFVVIERSAATRERPVITENRELTLGG